jgi:hypothetical protein
LIGVFGPYNLVAYNRLTAAKRDFIVWYGHHNRFTNNFSDAPNSGSNGGAHIDFSQTGVCCGRTGGTSFYTQEANFHIGANPSVEDTHFANQETSPDNSSDYLSRRNIGYSSAGGAHGVYEYTSTYIVHDLYAFLQQSGSTSFALYIRNSSPRIYNTMFVDAWGSASNAQVFDAAGAAHDYNYAWDSNNPSQTYFGTFPTETNEITNQDPLFTNYGAGDFGLGASSPARDTAGALTTTVGSGTGTAVTVADAGFFRGFESGLPQYGGNLAAGDIITIGTDVRRIASISGNVLTVTESLTWANGDGVHYGDNAVDNARGPYPYRSGGFTLSATYSCNGTICTTAPNDATLVRMVVCYSDRVPYQVVIDSPYICTDTEGTFEARVYPLYPSRTLWAVATP